LKIIVEGPNGTGKSYFISKLLSNNKFKDFEVEHCSQYSPNNYKFHENLLKTSQNMIFDRFYIGETIYPYLHNRKAQIKERDCFELFEKFKDTYIVFIDADYSFICKNLKDRHEEIDIDFIDFEKMCFFEMYKNFNTIDSKRVFRIKNHLKGPYYLENTVEKVIKDLEKYV